MAYKTDEDVKVVSSKVLKEQDRVCMFAIAPLYPVQLTSQFCICLPVKSSDLTAHRTTISAAAACSGHA